MATTVTITGTGTPIQTPDRAGPGVLIRHDDVALQFDAGRNTVARLAAAGQDLTTLTALFVTHHHSDHLIGLPDLVMTRWLNEIARKGQPPLPVYVPEGDSATIVGGMLDVWQDEMEMRRQHTGRPNVADVEVRSFSTSKTSPTDVARFGSVHVQAVAVEHDPVVPAVGYRIDTPDGSVVITGDTAVCDQIEQIAAGSDLLVTEAILSDGLEGLVSDPERLIAYHSECHEIGAMAERASVEHVLLTHLVPPPLDSQGEAAFAETVRAGGYEGTLTVARDLVEVVIGA